MFCKGDMMPGNELRWQSSEGVFSGKVDFATNSEVYIRLQSVKIIGAAKHLPLYPTVQYDEILWVEYGFPQMERCVNRLSKL